MESNFCCPLLSFCSKSVLFTQFHLSPRSSKLNFSVLLKFIYAAYVRSFTSSSLSSSSSSYFFLCFFALSEAIHFAYNCGGPVAFSAACSRENLPQTILSSSSVPRRTFHVSITARQAPL
jgi:hypothetical protein